MEKKQLAFYFNSSACSGCKTCQVACKDKHNSGPGVLWRRVYEVSGGNWKKEGEAWIPNVFSYHISMACNHCLEPICMTSCPNKAIFKMENGTVLIDENKCMGCRYCEWTCPYGALQFDNTKKVMTKCTLCFDYLAKGEKPSCVTACPMRVLDIGELEDLKETYGSSGEIFPLPVEAWTKPSLVITPHRDARPSGNRDSFINNREEVRHE